jgi:hypothetical protein
VPEHLRPRAVFAAILAGHPTREELDEAERQEEAADRDHLRTVAVLAAAGLPYRHIARAYRVSSSTAWHWARRGTELWHRDGNPEALAAALAALPPLDDQGPDRPPDRPRGPPGGARGPAGPAAARGHRRGVHRVGTGPLPRWNSAYGANAVSRQPSPRWGSITHTGTRMITSNGSRVYGGR